MAEDKVFESEMFGTESRWSTVVTKAPPKPNKELREPMADVYAELAWYELGHLKPGEACRLTGTLYKGSFYKTAEDTLLCILPDGTWGEYTHDSDLVWRRRRAEVEATVRQMEDGQFEVPD